MKKIDHVIHRLEEIIAECEQQNDPLGYFAALYHRVTVKIKEGIADGFFEDGPRMEQLDIVFAKRYIVAYSAYRKWKPHTFSWQRAFDSSRSFWPVVMQHIA